MTEGRSAPDAYGVDEGRQTCARCGHTTPTCERCGVEHPLLGASIGDNKYCHTFIETTPTCYMLAQWERPSDSREGDRITNRLNDLLNKLGPPR